ncbi:MAG: tRNA uridine-5-carboxymethylaminomethyl(34) synthesis enzyme MnmG [Oligoflexia bacterium]|nr:tRNA uridine-5-carboxymethylaminomethyl(34) synthesis enzyme MnmG [Oligoflexia bacterium]
MWNNRVIKNKKNYDIIVIGAGHAGVEAAFIAVQLGMKVAVITMPEVTVASAPCNPAIGGVAKGQIVRELDALGGAMGLLADKAAIQYRILNESKGYAVQSTRVQIDKYLYSLNAEELLLKQANIDLIKEEVIKVKIERENERVNHFFITTKNEHTSYCSNKLIITAGTFLNGCLHFGGKKIAGGRVGASASRELNAIGIEIPTMRFKTGTPARLKGSTIDFSVMEEQKSDEQTKNFHLLNPPFERQMPQISCFITRTNANTMKIIRDNKLKSPIFNGQINSIGPRYCPSIEDKANRYPDRDSHHIFIEPEGLNVDTTYYPNGLSTSLPIEIQIEFLKTIKGLENVEVEVPGYAVEYDVVDTTNLNRTLECKDILGLYFAGQVNGTSGYEEAAGQGIVAGINASMAVLGRPTILFDRYDTYLGVMIDDLVSNRRDEPYRLFTARSENRLLLREDNSINRIYNYRMRLSLNMQIDNYLTDFIKEYKIFSSVADKFSYVKNENNKKYFEEKGYGHITGEAMTLSELLKQSHLDPVKTLKNECSNSEIIIEEWIAAAVAISKRYDGYIKVAEIQNEKIKNLDSMRIYWDLLIESGNISYECRQRIKAIRPQTFGELRRIDGIRAATLAIAAGKLYG